MMRVLTGVVLMLLFALMLSPAFGEEKHPPVVTQVTAQGEADASAAKAREMAIADALSNAVMSSVGVYVDSTTIGSNYQTIKKDILLKAAGFATLDSVESVSVKNGILCATIKATVSNRPLVGKLKELGLTHEWKVGVYVPEEYLVNSKSTSGKAAELAIAQKLLGSGFRVIDESRRKQLQNEDIAGRAAQGDAAALKAIKREYDVDILVVGSASAEYVDQDTIGGVTFYRTRGRIEAKAFYTDTGEVLSTTQTSADGLDQTENLSAKRCLTSAGTRVGDTLASDMMVAPTGQSPFITMKITNFKTATVAADFEDALLELPGITRVKRQRYSGGTLELNVYIKSDFRDLLPSELEGSKIGKKLGVEVDFWSKTYLQGRVAGQKG